jgi:26S proteasome regulatory subunit N12
VWQVFLARDNVPAEDYAMFMDTLLHTIREEIATAAALVYPKLTVRAAQSLLFFDSPEELLEFAAVLSWRVEGDSIVFQQANDVHLSVPAKDLVEKTIKYAKELERIV